MPLTRDEKKQRKAIIKFYVEKKGLTKDQAETIANAKIYSYKRKIENM